MGFASGKAIRYAAPRMRRWPLVLCALGAAGCPGTARNLVEPEVDGEAPPPDAPLEVEKAAVAVRVVNWNTLNFFNDETDSPGLSAPEDVVTSAEYQAKLSAVSSVLASLHADVVVLEEVENQHVTDDIAAQLDGYTDTATTEGNDPRGIDIAVLSKLPITRIVSHVDDYFSPSTNPAETYVYARDCMQIELDVNGRRLILLGVHFKSAEDDASKLKRVAEAEHTRAILTQLALDDPDAAIVVLGDFNADASEKSVQALVGKPPTELTSVAGFVPEDERWSYRFDGALRLIDDQFMNGAAAALLDAKSPQILHGADVDAASDHAPVSATYLVR